jgi:hypothetical protein
VLCVCITGGRRMPVRVQGIPNLSFLVHGPPPSIRDISRLASCSPVVLDGQELPGRRSWRPSWQEGRIVLDYLVPSSVCLMKSAVASWSSFRAGVVM